MTFEDKVDESFAAYLRTNRAFKAWTVSELAKRAKLSTHRVASLERGRSVRISARLWECRALARALEIDEGEVVRKAAGLEFQH